MYRTLARLAAAVIGTAAIAAFTLISSTMLAETIDKNIEDHKENDGRKKEDLDIPFQKKD